MHVRRARTTKRRRGSDNLMDGFSVYREARVQIVPHSATLPHMGGLFLDVYIVYAFRTLWRRGNLLRSRKWNRMTATILGCHLSDSIHTTVSVYYEYATSGEKYAAIFEKPFLLDSSAQNYAGQFPKGAAFKIRVKPGDSWASVADSSMENWSLWWG